MAQAAESDLCELITARRAELDLQVEKLSQRLQEVREEVEELAVAERVARRLAEYVRVPAPSALTYLHVEVVGQAPSPVRRAEEPQHSM
ncbi:hypothetical protein [Streptomyces parvulus]|uniref:hypothetical protein n=1 Tax=Streptomyces parvulus TaxID=146923 RepID=UPI003EB913A4